MSIRDTNLDLYLKQLQNIFPGIDLTSASSLYNGAEARSGHIILSNVSEAFKQNLKLKKNTTLIHYTSVAAMLNIINDQYFRLYNCFNLNDPREVEYANNKYSMGFTEDEIVEIKQNYFVGSFCEYDINLQNEDFNQWRLYGNNGNGAALVFEIENIEERWENFFIGKICYDESNEIVYRFKKFIRFHKEFNEKYKLFENTPEILSAITLHFKDEIWKVENEFRLFTSCPFDKYTFENKFFGNQNSFLSGKVEHTINRNGEFVSYIPLPLNKEREMKDLQMRGLNDEHAKYFFSSIPHLKLKEIILGYNVSLDIFHNMDKLLDFYFKKDRLGRINLKFSSLKKKFN
ncbi:MAG: DUF2971 domain-containing protein [Ginsengibacter sp.]